MLTGFNSIATMQLVERNLIGLDDDVMPHLPEIRKLKLLVSFDGDEPVFEDIKSNPTVRQLLTHTSGFAYDWVSPAQKKFRETFKLGDMFWSDDNAPRSSIAGVPFNFQPGTSFCASVCCLFRAPLADSALQYSQSIDWLGFLIEVLSGQNLDEYFQDNIFKPLGISDMSFYELPGYAAKHTNVARRRDVNTGEQDKYGYEPTESWLGPRPQICLGGAGMRGSPRSYMRILRALLRRGELDGARILSPESVDIFTSPLIENEDVLKSVQTGLRYHMDPYSRHPQSGWVEGELSTETRKNWGGGGAYYHDTLESGRQGGSMTWSGAANLYWVLDPKSDKCFIIWCNTICRPEMPSFDANVYTMWREVERALYA